MPTHGKRDQLSDAPKFVTSAVTGKSGKQEYGNTVFLADAVEAQVANNIAHAGWIKRRVGTGGRSGRVQVETLVAMSSFFGDATDFANTSTSNVANTTGTVDDTVLPDA
ncbi:hypothetical protein EVB91_084 [Rhizobium phage RHph_I1_18]|nr:hypothetical protein EVB91_084 [Rhizobium phage RHph_I1_18]